MALLTERRRSRLLARCLVAVGCTAGLAGQARAQAAPGRLEQEVKAAYLLNFTRYVDWPADAFEGPDAPVNLCVIGGAGEFADLVQRSVQGRRSRGRLVRVLRPQTPTETFGCHVAFVAQPPRDLARWLNALRGAPALTVGEGPDFLDRGGMVAFVIVNETVRFEIHTDPARRAGLQVSSRVLSLATRLHGEP